MPRRPRKQPGSRSKRVPKTFDKNDGKIRKWNKPEDIELDDEDQFHQTRDRILLEGNARDDNEAWEDGEEEVFGLRLDTDSEQSVGDEELSGGDEKSLETSEPPSSKAKNAKLTKNAPPMSSSESESEEETWGHRKSAYYASNSEVLSRTQGEEDEDELYDMEEQEAKKIQTRMKSLLIEEDYGVNDVQASLVNLPEEMDITSAVPVGAPTESIDKAAAVRLLERTSPETLALSREWCDLLEDSKQVEERLKNGVASNSEDDAITGGLKHLHQQTLLSYMTVLAFYMHLRASPTIVNHPPNIPNARIKAVLERLLTLKQALSIMEDLDFDVHNDEDESDTSDLTALSDPEEESAITTLQPKKLVRISKDELQALLEEADEPMASRPTGVKKLASLNKGGSASRKKKGEFAQGQRDITFDLVEPSFKPSRPSNRQVRIDNTSDVHGEITELPAADKIDKKARRHTLRFHTHKIETSVRKREQFREKLGGDDDIPYSERKKEKEIRVQKEVLKTRGTGGDDLEVGSDNDRTTMEVSAAKRKRVESSDSEGEDGYYELVKRAKQDYKEEKKREYDQSRLAERAYNNDETEEGPRSLTRAILKNRGLTPRRSKSVRNPRVKKRERYEKAKRKVKSQKAVYRKDLGGKPYGGEQSGISKVVKSVKLG